MSKKSTPTSSDGGTNILEEANAFFKKVTALVGTAPALTATEMRRATKLRKGGEKIVPIIAALSNQFGLTIQAHPTDAMVAKINEANSLAALHKEMVAATKQVGDGIFQAQSESWTSASVHYATLRQLAVKDGSVATTLAPVKQFFARRARAKAAPEAEATQTATPAPTPSAPVSAPITTPHA